MSSRIATKLFFRSTSARYIAKMKSFPISHWHIDWRLHLCKRNCYRSCKGTWTLSLKSIYILYTAFLFPLSRCFRTAIPLLVSDPSFMEVSYKDIRYGLAKHRACLSCQSKLVYCECINLNRFWWYWAVRGVMAEPDGYVHTYRMGVIAFIDMPNPQAARRMLQ